MFLTGGVGYAIALRFGVYEQPVREMRVAGIRGVASALRAWRRQIELGFFSFWGICPKN